MNLSIHPSCLPVIVGVVGVLIATPGSAAELQPETVQAWNAYVAATEARMRQELAAPSGFLVADFTEKAAATRSRLRAGEIDVQQMTTVGADGKALVARDGLISHWRGAVFVPGIALDEMLQRLQHPNEKGPHQEDVLALRVLERQPDALKLYIRMTRSKIVTVTYDTEHEIRYTRHGATRASSRSVATKIAEIQGAGTPAEREKAPGEDYGFLWRMNSYWRYEQVDGGVIVELESLTLSRSIPLGLSVIVQPIINRIANESMSRTLDSLRTTYTRGAAPASWRSE